MHIHEFIILIISYTNDVYYCIFRIIYVDQTIVLSRSTIIVMINKLHTIHKLKRSSSSNTFAVWTFLVYIRPVSNLGFPRQLPDTHPDHRTPWHTGSEVRDCSSTCGRLIANEDHTWANDSTPCSPPQSFRSRGSWSLWSILDGLHRLLVGRTGSLVFHPDPR